MLHAFTSVAEVLRYIIGISVAACLIRTIPELFVLDVAHALLYVVGCACAVEKLSNTIDTKYSGRVIHYTLQPATNV